jgi:streptogramin lyase
LTLVWQTKFEGDSVLVDPGDIAVDKSGNIFVSTQSDNSVKKFDSEGKFITQWGSSGTQAGNFSLSLGVAVDGDGNVYVTDFYGKRIQKFDNNGKFLLQWPSETSTSPAFAAIDTQGNLYVDEFPPHDSHYVQKFDSNGKLLSEWGDDNGRFAGRIEDIAVDKDGNLYVADRAGHHIQKLDPNGKVIGTFGGDASMKGEGLFDDPLGVAVDNDGNIYALDSNFLQKLDSSGKFITQWSTHGGDLDHASNVAVDSQGNLYVFAKADVTAVNGSTINVSLLKKLHQP